MDADMAMWLKAAASLALVAGLIGVFALALRRVGPAMGLAVAARSAAKRRVRVVEMLPLDARRKLALIRHGDREHLLLLGAQGETVIASGRVIYVEHGAKDAPPGRVIPLHTPPKPEA